MILFGLLVEIILFEYYLNKLRPLIEIDEQRDSKYEAFRRFDTKWWKR